MPPRGFRVLPRRCIRAPTFAWIFLNQRIAEPYERLCATGEAFVYAAITRLVLGPLAVRKEFPDNLSRRLGEKLIARREAPERASRLAEETQRLAD